MNRLLLIAFAFGIAVSCTKISTDTPDMEGKSDFNWSTLTQKSVMLTEASNLVNEDGKTVATNLAPGSYSVTTGLNSTLSIVPAATKADGLGQFSIPSIDGYATMMIEDLFPKKGDYDMNDAVVDFRVDYLFDNMQLVKTIRFNIVPRAVGCPQELIGLAVNLSGMHFLIESVTRSNEGNLNRLFGADETTLSNGVNGVIPLTGDLRSHFTTYETGVINAHKNVAYNQGNAFTVEINLAKGIFLSDLILFGTNPNLYNIDLFAVVGQRSKEIHLKGQKPTPKFDRSLLGTLTDFVTPDNYVWLMVTDQSIAYPTEGAAINAAYPNFDAWVKSDGKLPYNWYDTFNTDKIYNETK